MDATPASRTWTIQPPDTTAPDTTIDTGPSGTVTSSAASFAFSASESGSTFQCSLDSTTAYTACSSPKDYSDLAAGSHTFRVRAIDAAGNVDATPASRTWTIQPPDTTAPDTTIETGPSGTHRSGTADFAFSASEAGASFECRLDGGAFSACGSTPTFHVANGRHELEVRALDAAGNADATPSRRGWWADALLQNGNFETPLAGWTTQGGGYAVPAWKSSLGTLSLVSGGIAGPQAGRVTATAPGSLSMNASPWPINSAHAGTTYTVKGSIRSDTPGKTVCLRVREWDADAVVGSGQQCLATTASWREFATLQYTALRGGSELELYAYQTAAAVAGESFELDGMSLSDGSPAAVSGDARRRRAIPFCSPPATWPPAGRAATSPSRGCWTRCPARSSSPATPSRTTAMRPSSRAATTRAGAATRRAPSPPSAITSTAPARPPGTSTTSARHDGRARQGLVQLRPGRLAHRRPQQQLRRSWAAAGPAPSSTSGSSRTCRSNAGSCVGAYWHHPRFSAGGTHGNKLNGQPFWDLLYQHGAEWVLGGNDHNYQRFAPQTPTGELDRARGMRQFVVGVGGTMHYPLGTPLPNTEVQNSGTFGVLKLTLHDTSYDWRFLGQDGKTFTDSGSTDCSPLAAAEPPETTIDSGPSGTVPGHRRLVRLLREPGRDDVRVLAGRGRLHRLLLTEELLGPRRGRAHLPRACRGPGRRPRSDPGQPDLDDRRAAAAPAEPDHQRELREPR